MKIVLLGEINVGKTTLLTQFCTGNTDNIKPTIGADYLHKEIMVKELVF